MTTEAPGSPMTPRPGWVVFTDDPGPPSLGKQPDGSWTPPKPHPAVEAQPITSVTGTALVGTSKGQFAWAQFEEQQVTPVPGVRQSVCSSPSFWSTDPPSESSGTSQSEEQRSSSVTRSSYSLVFQEDEGIDTDSLNWHINGQSEIPTTRFASWVTFDDDEEPSFQVLSSAPSVKPPNGNTSPTLESDSDLIGLSSPIQTQEVNRHLLDLTSEGSNPTSVVDGPLLSNSVSHSSRNPFLDEGLSHLLPSPINPFSDFFQERELNMAPSNDFSLGNVHLSHNTPLLSVMPELKKEPLSFLSPVSDSSDSRDILFCPPPGKNLDRFKGLWIADTDQAESTSPAEDTAEPDEMDESVYQPDHMHPQDGWPVMLRIPEKKNIMSSRHWGPIYVKLSNSGCLQLFYEKGLEKPFKEIQLDSRHELSEHKLQSYDESSRVHTLSIDYVTYKEKRKIQPKVAVVRCPVRDQVVKLGTIKYQDFLSFTHTLRDTLMWLPIEAEPLSCFPPFLEEEVVVDVWDEFHGVVSKDDSKILQQLVVTHLYVLAFVSGSPTCRIGINDIQVKGNEVVSLHDIIPNTTARWIRLRDCRFHSCADERKFADSRVVAFTPLAGCRFELLRFRSIFVEKSLPFTLRTVVSVKGAEVELQSWLSMSTGFSSNCNPLTLIPCENVMIRYHIPLLWAKNFRRDSVVGEKSLKARFNKGASFGSTSSSGQEPAMKVTLGTAKYEHAFRAVVWRISTLPDKNSALGHPHTLFCRLELGSDWEVPPKFQRHVEVEFDMPAASASWSAVRSLSVGNRTDVKKWINYKSHYSYQVEMEQKTESLPDGSHMDQPSECSLQ